MANALDLFSIPSGLSLGKRYKAVSASYTTLVADEIVGVSGASVTITLADTCKWPGKIFTIKDVGGAAGTSPITVTPQSGNLDGSSNYILNLNYQAIDVFNDGTNWFVA